MPHDVDVQAEPVELTAPEKLTEQHDVSGFACGDESIDDYLQKRALNAQKQKHAAVYVSLFKGTNRVAAFYTLSAGSVVRGDMPKSMQRNAPNAIPATILGRMGVSHVAQGFGFAEDLLRDAIGRCLGASTIVASAAIVVHPLSERLAEFYARKAGFVPCPALLPMTMILSLR
jgi:hypothetical protein